MSSLDISRRYGAEWQQYYGELTDTDYDYADDYAVQGPGADGADAYFQPLSGEVPAVSGEQFASQPATSGEIIAVEGTPDEQTVTTAGQSCVTGSYHPSSSNCSAFHVCRRGRLTEVACPSDMWFDPRHKDDVLCNYPEVVCAADNSVCDCAEKYPPLPPDPLVESAVTCLADQRFHFTASQVECGRYFVCFNEHVRRLECREGLQFNPETERCDYPEIVNCQVSVRRRVDTRTGIRQYIGFNQLQIIDPDCPREGISFLPHADQDDAFYFCVHGYKTLQTCPFYHVWNAETNACRPRQETAEADAEPKHKYNFHNGYY